MHLITGLVCRLARRARGREHCLASALPSPELELESDGSGQGEMVGRTGGNGLVRPGCEVPRRGGRAAVRFELEVDRTVVYSEITPSAFSSAVGPQQSGGQRVLVERAGSSDDGQTFGELAAIA